MSMRAPLTLIVTALITLTLSHCSDATTDGRCIWCGGSGGSYEYDDFTEMYVWKTCNFCYGTGEDDDD